MAGKYSTQLQILSHHLKRILIGPQTLAFLPALTLGGFWFGGEMLLIVLALLLPAAFAVGGMFSGTGPAWTEARDKSTGMMLRGGLEKFLDQILTAEKTTGKSTATLAIELDEFEKIQKQYGAHASKLLIRQTSERIIGALRETDEVAKLDGHRFVVALGPTRRTDIETLVQLAARIQAAIADPYSVDATRIYLTASVGFCLPGQISKETGALLIECAETALESASGHGAGSVRTYSRDLKQRAANREALHDEVGNAIELGQIRAWFQPQISTDTGQITGFEALPRWEHPDRGTILPRDFLPAVAELKLQERLGELTLSQSLLALQSWDKSGYSIPTVSVNFSSPELENPSVCEKIRWELDRFELEPDRLCIDILEDVIAAADNDIIVRNISALSKMGCSIDLDDFGTGHASIANIRRFAVHRIKIDRSFITRVDRDRDQQNLIAAVLTMAERLNIDTIAEGVETVGEHAMLAQLGCRHVQGFSVARPMPFDATIAWIKAHLAKQSNLPAVGQRSSDIPS